ncbi:MAG: hypothetical protein JW947_02795 [Sedimentisphaerales bacterium]|nr:hypothetical protein [Sedimentisphaerales bacterium]
MTEQDKQNNPPASKKKPCLACRILWLVWIGFLLVLLTAGLFLQAPLKVISLVIIFLLAATILPRVYRKWFWTAVGCAVAAVVIWIFLPEEIEGWRPYTFDKDIAALEAKYAIPDEQNAASIYNELLHNYDYDSLRSDIPEGELAKLPVRKPWLSSEHPAIAEWLNKNQLIINMLLNASKIEQCRFPISSDAANVSDTMYRLIMARKWADLLISAANNDMAEGRTNLALEKYIAALRIAKHLHQQPALINFLVGAGIESFAMSQLERFAVLGDSTENDLNIIEQALTEIKHDWSDDFPRFLEHDKLLTKNFWGKLYAVSQEGKTRLNPGAIKWETRETHLPGDYRKDMQARNYWHQKWMKSSTILRWLYMPATPQEAGAMIDAAFEKYYPAIRSDSYPAADESDFSFASIKFNCRYMIDMQLYILEPVYSSIHNTHLRTIAQQRGCGLILALRRYKNKNGNWPDSLNGAKLFGLEEIFVDPVNGGSFVYILTNDNFILYSKGRNGIDDGGIENERTGADDQIIWSGERL